MAEASRTEKKTVVEETVTLVLSLEEAKTLEAIGWRVGGSLDQSARGHMDKIFQALHNAGIQTYGDLDYRLRVQGGLYFLDRPVTWDD